MLLLSGFAVAALLLAVVGVYGLVSQSVTGTDRGNRPAYGARRVAWLRAVWLVFRDGMRLSASRHRAGALGAVAMARMMRSLLFQVPALDRLAFTAGRPGAGRVRRPGLLPSGPPRHPRGPVDRPAPRLLSGYRPHASTIRSEAVKKTSGQPINADERG